LSDENNSFFKKINPSKFSREWGIFMKSRIWAILAVTGITGCFSTEPKTEVGSVEGILFPQYLTEGGYWHISLSQISGKVGVINVLARPSSGYDWWPATFTQGPYYIKIMDDNRADPGWQYRISWVVDK
jgi:hypothetical protein